MQKVLEQFSEQQSEFYTSRHPFTKVGGVFGEIKPKKTEGCWVKPGKSRKSFVGNFDSVLSFHSFARVFNMEVKERIQQKAHELFMKFGIRSVSMDDIANQIGVSKKTIYQFFADKDALVGDIIQEEVVRMEQECVYCSVNARDAVDEIFLTIEIILEQFKSFNPTLVFDLRKFHHQAYQKIEAHKREYLLGLIIRNLERGVEEGIYREDIKIPVIARFRLESMMLAFDTELFPPKQFDLADITRELIELFVYGVANEKGYQLIEKYKRDLQQKLNTHANK